MDLIIDGYNLMHKAVFKNGTLEEKRERIISIVEEFCEVNSNRAVIVFDAAGTESNMRSKEKRKNIKLVFSAKGESADDAIADIITRKNPKKYIVVTSDRYIRDIALNLRFNIMKSEELAQYF
ncbi:MAG: NYN domain-containing protein [Candidatus Goldiibacteriota bacterium]